MRWKKEKEREEGNKVRNGAKSPQIIPKQKETEAAAAEATEEIKDNQ
jgi:hypothetical protein